MGLVTFRREISPLRFASVEMTVVVSSRAEEHIGMGGKNLNLLNSMNPGRGAAHPAAPFRLAALATHPRKGGGQVKRRRGPYSLKFAASAATTTLGLKGRQT